MKIQLRYLIPGAAVVALLAAIAVAFLLIQQHRIVINNLNAQVVFLQTELDTVHAEVSEVRDDSNEALFADSVRFVMALTSLEDETNAQIDSIWSNHDRLLNLIGDVMENGHMRTSAIDDLTNVLSVQQETIDNIIDFITR